MVSSGYYLHPSRLLIELVQSLSHPCQTLAVFNMDSFVSISPIEQKDGSLSGPTVPLSVLDEVMPRVYVRIFLCFPHDDAKDKSQTISVLKEGLSRTITMLPFLAAEVVPAEGPKKGKLELRGGQGVELKTKDLSNSASEWTQSYKDLNAKKMPISAFQGDVLIPVGFHPSPNRPTPVIVAQATFIKGGLILCLCVHHSVLDGPSIGTVCRIWARNCQEATEGSSEASVESEEHQLGPECLDKSPLLETTSTTAMRDHPEYIVQPEKNEQQMSTLEKPGAPPPRPQTAAAAIFHFSSASLARLKADISSDPLVFSLLSQTEDTRSRFWLSTNDALCGLLWYSITKARRIRHLSEGTSDEAQQPRFTMAVNGRRRLEPPLAANFLGNVNIFLSAYCDRDTLNGSTQETVSSAIYPAAVAARTIREALRLIDNNFIRTAISFLGSVEDISRVTSAYAAPGDNTIVTSWAGLPLYQLNWGKALGGRAAYVRLPYGGSDGVCVVLPPLYNGDNSDSDGGGLEVVMYLRSDDMNYLLEAKDELIHKYASLMPT